MAYNPLSETDSGLLFSVYYRTVFLITSATCEQQGRKKPFIRPLYDPENTMGFTGCSHDKGLDLLLPIKPSQLARGIALLESDRALT
ncbi:hypothetical protein NBRC116583_21310 [Arenicella sp. 4NH20-0111]|uniref:hypothetical protein n=1 Tax=Arenicella sp. 4NH20-0111 TaxID=3127648 RepID=UPI003104C32E